MAKKDKFPGFEACMQMMQKHDPLTKEDGFHWLLPHASQYVGPLMEAFAHEKQHGLQCWLLELIGEAKSVVALPLFVECMKSDDADLRLWAMYGLKKLDTKEARSLLHEAEASTLPILEETRQYQRVQEEKASPVPPELGARGRLCL